MNQIISKELLSAVLGQEIYDDIVYASDDIRSNFLDGNDFVYTTKSTKFTCHRINIHELAHKCKEWANSIGYKMESGTNCLIGYSASTCRSMTDDGWTVFQSDTEYEAVFQACQWILDNKDKS